MGEEDPDAAVRKVVFDTDVLIWYFRGSERARRFLAGVPHPLRAVSALVLMELVQGCRTASEIRDVKAFVSDNIALVLHPDDATSHGALQLLESHAARDGLRVIDALIAATALRSGSALASANVRHYRAIPRLELIAFRP